MKIDNLRFQPWQGNRYGNESIFQIPILIVGESNHGVSEGAEKDAFFTHLLINSIIDARWRHNFFSNIQRSFVENANTQELRSEFWHSVAHHEYIQDWLPRPEVAPDEEMWKKAKPIFREVVAELKPKCILFVCKRVFDRVSLDFPASNPLFIDADNSLTLEIYQNPHPTVKIDNVLASWIYHPTSRRGGFRRPRGVVSSLIKSAGGTDGFSVIADLNTVTTP
ncbi:MULTISPECIES: hypothetical protein [Pseudanabaena]|jgi:hypothetical protein|uniref:hypothetical protein n=1 Tax=Pseudanabaena TaxID=1152 RepID=UPI002479A264|nr:MULTISPECIES: hypothetical protein [Pseudanabaena]MEA5485566.1 hypothetical protein [Pseudanabaena sp. CCNP1317]WGS70703.1 hypothetical protein OA858_13305 [Pseudanabaena galeata CCNP1313]